METIYIIVHSIDNRILTNRFFETYKDAERFAEELVHNDWFIKTLNLHIEV